MDTSGPLSGKGGVGKKGFGQGGAIGFKRKELLSPEDLMEAYKIRTGKDMPVEDAIRLAKEKNTQFENVGIFGKAKALLVDDLDLTYESFLEGLRWVFVISFAAAILWFIGSVLYDSYRTYAVERDLNNCMYEGYKSLGQGGDQARLDALVILCMRTRGYDYTKNADGVYRPTSYK